MGRMVYCYISPMKNVCTIAMLATFVLLLSSCATTSYMGDKFAATSNIDVFYDVKDVKKEYRVIGHIYASTGVNADKVKESILAKARAVGADGVIILGLNTTGAGKNTENVQQADAIKYPGK